MPKGAIKRLKSVFAAAALGLAGITAIFTSGCAPRTENKGHLSKIWNDLIRNQTIAFDENSKTTDKIKDPIFVQVESELTSIHRLTLHPLASPSQISSRHGEAAAHLMNEAADRVAGEDVDIRYIEDMRHINDWILNYESDIARAIFEHARVITLSMGFLHNGDQSEKFSVGNIDMPDEIAKADEFWRETRAILTLSAGNMGEDPKIGMERAAALHTARADTLLKVGEAIKTSDGDVLIAPHSSRANVSVVAVQPYSEEETYRYLHDATAFRKLLNRILDTPADGYGNITVRQVIREKLILQLYVGHPDTNSTEYYMGITLPRGALPAFIPPALTIPNFNKLEFTGKDILLKNARWQADHPDQVIEAYINGLVASLPAIREAAGADKNGVMSKLSGTSFSAPHVGGMVSGGAVLYPDMTEYELTALALLAAQPVGHVLRPDGRIEEIKYANNGRGLSYNSYEAGFGNLEESAYVRALRAFADHRKAHPKLSAAEMHIDTGLLPVKFTGVELQLPDFKFEPFDFKIISLSAGYGLNQNLPALPNLAAPKLPQAIASYSFDVTEDIVALRTNFTIKFAKGSSAAPETITLISPSGGEVTLSPTRTPGGARATPMGIVFDSNTLSLASTDGFFGNRTKGKWTIKLPQGCEIESIGLTAHGFEKDGMMDQHLRNVVDRVPYTAPIFFAPVAPAPASMGAAKAGQYSQYVPPAHLITNNLADPPDFKPRP